MFRFRECLFLFYLSFSSIIKFSYSFISLHNIFSQQEVMEEFILLEFNKLPLFEFRGEGKYKMCSICMQDFQKGEKLVQISCGHHFHYLCIQKWFQKKAICPNCKKLWI